MRSAIPEFDEAGTWVASSYVHTTARDFARDDDVFLLSYENVRTALARMARAGT